MGKQGILVIAGIIIAVALTVAFSLPADESADLSSITIVANLPITGPGSGIGIEERDGLQLAVDDLNAFGGINDRDVELVIVDNETDLDKAKKLFLETEQAHNPLLHISSLSFISTGLAPLAEEHEVVLIALSSAAPVVTQDRDWTFRYFVMADTEAVPILQILDDLNVNNLGILYLNDEFGRAIANAVGTKFENSVTQEPFDPNTVDFKENIAKLQNKDAIFIVAFTDYIKIIHKQLREANYQGEILTTLDGATFDIFAMPEADGVYLIAPIIYDTSFQLASQISYSYESRYDKQLDYNAANSYDIIRILHGLLDEEDISRDGVKDVLNSGFIYSGIFGTVQVPPGDHDMIFQLFPAKIVKGELQFGKTDSPIVRSGN